MKVFKTSYSTLSTWARGDYDLALSMYFHRSDFDTPAMAFGRAMHTQWEREIKKTGRMPVMFGGRLLKPGFRCEVFASKMLAPWLEVRGKLDLLTDDAGFDWKTGITASTAYGNSYQHKVYQVLYPHLKRFEYHAYNQYSKKITVSIVHLSPKTLAQGIDWLVTHASEMKQYIEDNDLERVFAELPPVEKVKG